MAADETARQHHPILLITLALLTSRLAQSLASVSADKFDLQYTVKEEMPTPYSFGNLLTDSELGMNWNRSVQAQLTFNILQTDFTRSGTFHVNQKGLLQIIKRLDRDLLCPRQLDCQEILMISSNPAQFSKLFQVRIRILDVNDQKPSFTSENHSLVISETSNIGAMFELPLAIDNDSAKFGVQHYGLLESSHIFDLMWNAELQELKLRLQVQLDREVQDRYQFTLLAVDGGLPELTGTLNLVVNVYDANDNSPRFSQRVYSKVVAEDLAVRAAIVQVNASDLDSGANAKLEYSIRSSASRYIKETFRMDKESGILRLEQTLDFETVKSLEIPIEVSDCAIDSAILHDYAVVQLDIEDRNDQTPSIIVVPQPKNSAVHVMENASSGTVIAYIFVTDEDSGLGGQVVCSTNEVDFLLEEIGVSQGQSQYKLLTARTFDHELTSNLSAHLRCNDKGLPVHWSSQTLSITIDDVNDNWPKFVNHNGKDAIFTQTLYENNNMWIAILQISALDNDAGENGRVSYSIQQEFQNVFRIEKNGSIFSKRSLDREVKDYYEFLIYAKDHGEPSLTSNATIRINVLDVNDCVPNFHSTIDMEVYENATHGVQVGRLYAEDRDLQEGGQKWLRYSLQPDQLENNIGAQKFRIDEYGRVLVNGLLDREQNDHYSIYVLASDQGTKPLTGTGTVNIRILDNNDNTPRWLFPESRNQRINISYSLFVKDQPLVYKFHAVDNDLGANAKIHYRALSGTALSLLSINFSTGAIIAQQTLTPQHSGDYNIRVEARDNGYPPMYSETVLYLHINASVSTNLEVFVFQNNVVNFFIIIVIIAVTVLVSSILVFCIVRLHRYTHSNNAALNDGFWSHDGDQRLGYCCSLMEENQALKPVIQETDGRTAYHHKSTELQTTGSHLFHSPLPLRSKEYVTMSTLPRHSGTIDGSSTLRSTTTTLLSSEAKLFKNSNPIADFNRVTNEIHFCNRPEDHLDTTYVSYTRGQYEPPRMIDENGIANPYSPMRLFQTNKNEWPRTSPPSKPKTFVLQVSSQSDCNSSLASDLGSFTSTCRSNYLQKQLSCD